MVFCLFKKIQLIDFSSFALYKLTLNPSVNSVWIKFSQGRFLQFALNHFHCMFCIIKNALYVKFRLFFIDYSHGFWTIFYQISWHSNNWNIRNQQVSAFAETCHLLIKVAEHIFSRVHDCKKNKHAINLEIILFTSHTHYLCYFTQ